MDPCDKLRADLEIAIDAKWIRDKETYIRAVLGFFGLEWAYDLIMGKGISWKFFIDLIIMGSWVAALLWLVNTLKLAGLTGIAGKIATRLGPWGIAFLIIDLIFVLESLASRLGQSSTAFNSEVKEIYEAASDCEERDQILAAKQIPIPR